jgi:hypothetical protein
VFWWSCLFSVLRVLGWGCGAPVLVLVLVEGDEEYEGGEDGGGYAVRPGHRALTAAGAEVVQAGRTVAGAVGWARPGAARTAAAIRVRVNAI